MKRAIPAFCLVSLLAIFALAGLAISQQPTSPTAEELQKAIDVQPRGPLHEAYAQPFDGKAQPSAPTPKEPPPLIPEEPPEQRPESDDAQWIPGYWAWDAERQDFLWVSGVYRISPQGRTFVPGYWTQTPEGWRWVAGFWAPTQQQEVPYTPQPPAPLDEAGPSLPPPDDTSTYIPGSWSYRDSRFIWRPGFYAPYSAGRLWIPPHYTWTPQGYLFIDGYWDYPLEDRGLVFAPVYFSQPLWHHHGWRYRPSFVVSIGGFCDSAFVRVGGLHFYFGNYYGNNYSRLGYNPWYTGRGRYDPAFAHYGVQHRATNPNFLASAQRTYAGRSAGTLAAPPVTLAQQNALLAANGSAKGGPRRMVAPLDQASTVNQVRLAQASPTQVNTQRALAEQTRKIAVTRSQLDAASNPTTGGGPRANVPRSLSLPTVLQGKGAAQGGTITNSRPAVPTNPTPSGPTISNGGTQSTPSKGGPTAQPGVHIQSPTVITPKAQPQPGVHIQSPTVITPKAQPQPGVNIQPPTVITPKAQPQPGVHIQSPTVTTPQAQPRINTPSATPPTIVQPRINTPSPQAQPRINTSPAPKASSLPPSAPRANPPSRPSPPPGKKASLSVDPPRVTFNATRQPSVQRVTAPASQSRPPGLQSSLATTRAPSTKKR